MEHLFRKTKAIFYYYEMPILEAIIYCYGTPIPGQTFSKLIFIVMEYLSKKLFFIVIFTYFVNYFLLVWNTYFWKLFLLL